MDGCLLYQIEGQGRSRCQGECSSLSDAGVSHADIWEEHPVQERLEKRPMLMCSVNRQVVSVTSVK